MGVWTMHNAEPQHFPRLSWGAPAPSQPPLACLLESDKGGLYARDLGAVLASAPTDVNALQDTLQKQE